MTRNPIWPPPQRAKIKNKYNRGIIELKRVILVPNSMFFSMIYSLMHLKNAHIVHMTWRPLWPPPKMAKLTNKGTFGNIGPRKLILVCNSMFMRMIYSLVHWKCTQNSHDLKSNMATIESPKMLSLINWYFSQKNSCHKSNESEMCCKNSNKAVTWSMFRSVSYGVSFLQTIQAVQADGAQMWWGLSSPLDKDRLFWSGFIPVVHVEQRGGVVSFHYLHIIDMNPTGLNLIYSTLYILVKLGGFHTIMNGLDASGHIMAGCGLQWASEGNLGAVSIRKTVLPGMAIPMLKIRRPNGRLIFNMEIAIRR